MEYIVTGAGGYVGYAIVQELLHRGITPRCLVNSEASAKRFESMGVLSFRGDIRKLETLNDLFNVEGDIVVIHSAAKISVRKKLTKDIYDINVVGTENVIQKCKEKKAKLVYISSIEAIVHGAPIIKECIYKNEDKKSCYGYTKARASKLVLEAVKDGLDACILLPTAVFGPYDYRKGPMTRAMPIYLNHTHLPLVKGGYDLVDSRDIAIAAVNACEKGKKGESYILSNRYVPFLEVVNLLRDELKLKHAKRRMPNWILKTFYFLSAPFYAISKKEPVFTRATIDFVNTKYEYSHELATKDLGFNPRPIEDSVKDTLDFYIKLGLVKQKKKN